MLPLRHRVGAVPTAVIAFTSDDGVGAGDGPTGWLTPSVPIAHYFSELIDIGAGVAMEE